MVKEAQIKEAYQMLDNALEQVMVVRQIILNDALTPEHLLDEYIAMRGRSLQQDVWGKTNAELLAELLMKTIKS